MVKLKRAVRLIVRAQRSVFTMAITSRLKQYVETTGGNARGDDVPRDIVH